MNNSTIDNQEVSKFERLSEEWWDVNGPLKTLHDINETRLKFINDEGSLKDLKVLDVGCGGGILTEAMKQSAAICSGIDAEKKAIQIAKTHAESEGLDISYYCMPIEQLTEDSTYDVITCMEMLEHVKDPMLVIKHCARLLKPGGRLYLSTINRCLKAYAGAIVFAEYLLKILPKQTHDYNKFITPSELARYVRESDLEVNSIKGMSYNPISRQSKLTDDVSINYLMSCTKGM